jgi:hypothetical protein
MKLHLSWHLFFKIFFILINFLLVLPDTHVEIDAGFHTKWLLKLSNWKENWNGWTILSNILQYKILWESIQQLSSCFMPKDGQMEALSIFNRCWSRFVNIPKGEYGWTANWIIWAQTTGSYCTWIITMLKLKISTHTI